MFHKSCYIFVAVLLAFCASVQCDNNELDSNVDKLRSKLPEGLSDKIPDQYKNITAMIPQKVNDALEMFKEKCNKLTGDEEAYKNIVKAGEMLKNCTGDLIDFTTLQDEIHNAQPSGELDAVFNKYCRKRVIAIECLKNFTHVTEPCLEPQEIDGQKTIVKIFTNLLNFVCYKDGDQIALFIAEKGPECFKGRKDELIQCMNETFYNYLPSEKDIEKQKELPKLPQLVMGIDQCNDMDKLQICVVKSLEQCVESTPANLVESMFKFVRNETPCVNLTTPITRQKATPTNDAYSHLVSTNVIILALVLIISQIF